MELRSISLDERAEFIRTVTLGFGHSITKEPSEPRLGKVETDRTRVVVDRGQFVGWSGAYTFRLAVPGGASVGASGVTAVGVKTTHRRRGILRQMMTELLDDAVERGEAAAILQASEGAIYGRFGYGLASDSCRLRLDARTARLRPFDDPGTIDLVDGKDRRQAVGAVWGRIWDRRAGGLELPEVFIDARLEDDPDDRDGASELLCAVHRAADGTVDGYALYRLKPSWGEDGNPDGTVKVWQVEAADDIAYLALWRFLLSIDLMTTVEAYPRPVDDPVRWALTDPRHARIDLVGDELWVRPLDVAALLAARSYRVVDDLVLDVVDDTRPEVGGRFRLTTSADGTGSCARTGDPSDVTIGIAELGSLSLGGVRPSTLAAAGRLAADAATLRRLDLLFSWDETPYLTWGF
ncbi:MAG: GNAT family N-acetyltransferase [Actinomycetota bacterium]|nr:GNAT family N-acetyltransferase [Actinomycetota bacterium]